MVSFRDGGAGSDGSGLKKNIPAILISLMLITIFVFSIWNLFLRPISVDELAYREFRPGDIVDIEGRIVGIRELNTSYGKITLVRLAGAKIASESYELIVENDMKYHVGDTYRTTLHFKEYRFNGARLVTAPELFGTLMKLPAALKIVTDASSFLGGFSLIPESYEYPTYRYRVFTPVLDEYPLDMLNMTLVRLSLDTNRTHDQRTFPALFAKEYLNIGSAPDNVLGETVDFTPSLKEPSVNGTVTFVDKDLNGMLNDGDEFIINLSPTQDEFHIDTYLLLVGSPHEEYPASGMKYIINWYHGPYCEKNHVFLSAKYLGERRGKGWSESRIMVGNFSLKYEIRAEDCSVSLNVDEKNGDWDYMRLDLNETEKYDRHLNISIKYMDTNQNGLLDNGDIFLINGSMHWKYDLKIETKKTEIIEPYVSWCYGIGHISGDMPDIEWEKEEVGSSTKYTAHPYYVLSSMTLRNASVRIVFENGEETEVPLLNGTLYSNGGVLITFTDADSNGMVSDGDYFTFYGESDLEEIDLFLGCRRYNII